MRFVSSKLFLFALISLFIPFVHAAEEGPLGIAPLVGNFYDWALGIGALVALGVIVFGGVLYTGSAGNVSRQEDAKQWIFGAFVGLLILFGSYVILNTINPSLLTLSDVFLPVNEPSESIKVKAVDYTTIDPVTGSFLPVDSLGDLAREPVRQFIEDEKISFPPNHSNDKNAAYLGYAVRITDSSLGDRTGERVPINPKIWGVMAYLVNEGFTIEVSSMIGKHSICAGGDPVGSDGTCGGRNISAHWDGRAIDISTINSKAVETEAAKQDTIALLLALRKLEGDRRPHQVIALGNGKIDPDVYSLQINGLSPSLENDHLDHVHIGY